MDIVHEAARALVEIDRAGMLRDLGDEVNDARREFKQSELSRPIGETVYIDGIAKILSANGIDSADAWSAVREAIRPTWQTVLLQTIIAFERARVV